ncbi:MAG: hypothetical protein AB7D37_11255 [Desulfovibrio sp.]
MEFPVNWPKMMNMLEAEKNAEIAKLQVVLQTIVSDPSNPGTWLQMAKDALRGE